MILYNKLKEQLQADLVKFPKNPLNLKDLKPLKTFKEKMSFNKLM